jgi:carboxypeptidase PM20D1
MSFYRHVYLVVLAISVSGLALASVSTSVMDTPIIQNGQWQLEAQGNGVVKPEDTISLPAIYLSEYVQIESVTGNEKEAGLYLQQLARDKGLIVHVFTDAQDSYNFAASLYPLEQSKPNVILLNHIDVVPPGEDSLWTHPPFSGAIKDGYVWGRGAIDNKAMGIMQLMALADFIDIAKENDLPYNVTMLAVSGEETGGEKGTGFLVDNYLEVLNPIVIYGEGGTGLRGVVKAKPDMPFFGIETAQKRGVWFSIRLSDPESGHGSIPREFYPAKQIAFGSSSLLSHKQPIILTRPAKTMLREIGRHERGVRKLALRNIGFFRHFIGNKLRADPITNALLTNTITLTGLNTSEGSYNQIAQNATATFDSRLLPGTDVDKFLGSVAKHFDLDYDQINIISKAPESGISETGKFYEALEKAVFEVFGGIAVAPILFPAHNDNLFFRQQGIPAYGLLPVILPIELTETIHNVNERMPVQSLIDGINVYKSLMNILLLP